MYAGFLACIDDICVLAMFYVRLTPYIQEKIITIDRTPKGQYEFKHTPENLGEVYAPSLVN